MAIVYGTDVHIDLLLHAGADVNTQMRVSGRTLPMQAIGARGNYHLVWRLLQLGADYNLKTVHGEALANVIERHSIDPDNDENYMWREKVMEFLRSKGIEVHKPANEFPREKPLPQNWKGAP